MERRVRGRSEIASFPGLLCFVLRFMFGIIHRRRRAAKNREGLGNTVLACDMDVWWM